MNISLMPQRPPYVQFEQRAVEDRTASIAAGGLVQKDVDFVIVIQPGSKDTFEKQAVDWLVDLERMSAEGTYPPDWAKHFRQRYQEWKAGHEETELGLSVRHWPALSKAQAENLLAAGVRTVEDVAAMTEQAMQRVGMGSRELKNKALAYFETREASKAAEIVSAVRAENEDLKQRLVALEEKFQQVVADREDGKRKRA